MRHKCDGVHGVATDLTPNDTLDQWLLRNVSTTHHLCGTCKMGPVSDMLAVVDQDGRVHGLACLHVVERLDPAGLPARQYECRHDDARRTHRR